MDYKAELLNDYSTLNCRRIAQYAANTPKSIGKLIELMFDDDNRLAQKAAWAICMLGKKYPALMQAHVNKLIKGISSTKHNAIPRNSLRVLAEMKLSEENQSKLLNLCFPLVENRENAIAIRAFSMQIILNAGKQYPELLMEFHAILEETISFESGGMKSKFRQLERLIAKNSN